ncbi:hypothetical protein [Aquabacter spiritensis]|uniref:Capsular polysaccharide transport system permease protein n=1 Tax=Aquabacter spiritensis TaxID=933073 RepID=A0A4R3LZ51_9HYPH|nr:hypothetical protein [Aquabacter spiritensis]TCT04017.1 capsular polysaccharide transport system permease protein [Aquabacter spiritensis]
MNQQFRLPPPQTGHSGALALAGAKRRLPGWVSWNRVLFCCTLLIPLLVFSVYSLLIVTERYVSEARFMVRGSSSTNASGLAMMFRTFGIGSVQDDTFAIIDYMESRDAVIDLSKRLPLAEILNRPEADFWSGYGNLWENRTVEALYRQYERYVRIIYDPQTGISTLQVQTFRAQDSFDVARALLELGEEVVNRMNDRAHRDSIAHAEKLLGEAEQRIIAAQAALSAFRNRELLFDPNSTFGSSVKLIGALTTELATVNVQLQEMRERAPRSPSLGVLETRAAALQQQIEEQRAGVVGSDTSLSAKMAEYERLVLERNFADRALAAASTAIERARQEARQQQIYIETVAQPSFPDEPTEPKAWKIIATVLLFGGFAYGTMWLLLVGAREHADVET